MTKAVSLDQLRTIVDSINGAVSVTALRSGGAEYIMVNDQFLEMAGCERERYETRHPRKYDLIHPDDRERVAEISGAHTTVGEQYSIDYRIVRLSGVVRTVRSRVSVVSVAEVNEPVLLCVCTDITEQCVLDAQLDFLNTSAHDILAQPDSEAAVDATLKKLVEYFASDRAYVIELDYDLCVSYNTYEVCADGVSSEMSRLQAIPFSVSEMWFEILQNNNYVVMDDVDRIGGDEAELRHLLAEQDIHSIILAPLWRDGVMIGFVGVDNPTKATKQLDRLMALGDYIAVLLTRRDLSAKIERDREAMQRQNSSLLDNLPCGAALYEYDGRGITVIHINRRYWQLVGREPVDYAKASVFGMVHPDDVAIARSDIASAIRQGRNASCDLRIKYGDLQDEYRPFHVVANIVPKGEGRYSLYAFYMPISDGAMSLQEMLPVALSAVMSYSDDFSYVKDRDLRYVCCSRSCLDLLGLTDEKDIIGRSDMEIFGAERAEAFAADDRLLLSGEKSSVTKIENITGVDGRYRCARTTKYPLLDASGNVIGIYGASQDITESRERDFQLDLLTESIPGGLAAFEFTPNAIRVLYFNEGFYSFSGYTRDEYIKLTNGDPYALIVEEDKKQFRDLAAMLKSSTGRPEIGEFVYRCRTKSGKIRWFSLKGKTSMVSRDSLILNVVQYDVTEQREALEKLRVSEEENRLAIAHSGNIITKFDVKNRTLALPASLNRIFELPSMLSNMPNEQIELGRVSPETAEAYAELFERIARGSASGTATFQQRSSIGWRWLTARYTTVFADDGSPVSAVITFVDVTDQLEKEVVYSKWKQSLSERMNDSYTLFRCNLTKGTSFDSREGGLLDIDFGITEGTFDERTAEYAREYVSEEDREAYARFLDSGSLLAKYYRGRRSDSIEYRERRADGSVRWLRLTVDLMEYPKSKDVEIFMMYENIDEHKRAELLTLERSETDPLTGVLNRTVFIERLEDIVKKNPNEMHALLMLDVDEFKQVNDTLGHNAGDEVLKNLTARISSILRRGDLLGRLGGDEFFVFLKNIPNDEVAAAKAQSICSMNLRPSGANANVSVSIGIAMVPRDGSDFDTLYKKVDAALYREKKRGKNGYLFCQGA